MTIPVGSLAAYLSVRGAAQANRDILSVQRNLQSAGAAGSEAAGGIGRTEAALAATGRASTGASAGANKFRASQLSLLAATERYNAVLADENATVRQLATAEAALIRANERVTASRPMLAPVARDTEQATAATTRFAGSIGNTAKLLGTLGVGLGVFELIKKGIDISKEASQFQQSMLLIQTNANASAAEVKNMTAAVLALSPQVATKPNDLANALYHVEQNGLRGATALNALRVGAEGAKVGMADVEDTTNTMTIATASGIKGVQNMQKAMGFMIATAGTGDMHLKDLNESLSTGILSVAKGFGATMTDVAAILATLGDNGIRGNTAAQALRQTMMGFAKPAVAGAAALKSVGLSMTDLRNEMEQHGLVAAMNDLQEHMTAAGVTGSKVGAFITDAFGRRAGAGIGVLMGEIDRLNTKYAEAEKGAASFGAKWDATTKTTAFAFQRLGAQFEAAGISIVQKLRPAITSAATWLGTSLPAALSVLSSALAPTVSMIGTGLAGAWHTVLAVLGPVASALGAVGHFLADNKGLTTGLATAVIGMWAAFKAYNIATAALAKVGPALTRVGMAANGVRERISGLGLAGSLAMAGLGVAIGGLSMLWESHEAKVQANKQAVDDLTQAIEQDNDALGKQTRSVIEGQLAQAGAYQQALKLGISQKQLTDTVINGGAAWDAMKSKIDDIATAQDNYTGTTKDGQHATGEMAKAAHSLSNTLGDTNTNLGKAVQNANDVAAADGKATTAGKSLGSATKATSDAMADQSIKASDLSSTLDKLFGNTLTVRQQELQLRDALAGVDKQFKDNGTTLSQYSTKGRSNQEFLIQQVQGYQQLADSIATQTNSVPQAAAAYVRFIAMLQKTTHNAGLGTQAFDKFLESIHATPKDVLLALKLDHTGFDKGIAGAKKSAADAKAAVAKPVKPSVDSAEFEAGMRKLGIDWQGVAGSIERLHPGLYADPSGVKQAVAQAQAAADSLKQRIVPKFQVNASQARDTLQQLIDQENQLQSKTITITTGYKNTGSYGHTIPSARGTIVRGPGSGTSDTAGVYALSNGEAVIPAKATAAHMPLIAEGRGMAAGGLVHGVYRVGKGYGFQGSYYATLKDANGAFQDALHSYMAQQVLSQGSYGETIHNAGHPNHVQVIAQIIRSQQSPVSAAMKDLAKAADAAWTLDKTKASITSLRTQLASMTQYRSGVVSTLQGQFDPTQYGSIASLIGGVKGATAQDSRYAAEVNKLRAEAGGNKSLLGFINTQAAQGNSPLLDMLAKASKGQLVQLGGALGGLNTALLAGGNAATTTKFGKSVDQVSASVSKLVASQTVQGQHIQALINAVEKLTGRPIEVNLDGKPIYESTNKRTAAGLRAKVGH